MLLSALGVMVSVTLSFPAAMTMEPVPTLDPEANVKEAAPVWL